MAWSTDKRLLILFCVALVFLVGCGETLVDEDFIWRTDYDAHPRIMQAMRDLKYAGSHKLVRLGGFIGVDGNIAGSWNILGGSIEGSISSAAYVKYAWSVSEKRPFIHTLPFDIIDLRIDDTCIEPTIRYQFNVMQLQMVIHAWAELYGKGPAGDGLIESYNDTIFGMLIGKVISIRTVVKATVVISQGQLDAREYLLW